MDSKISSSFRRTDNGGVEIVYTVPSDLIATVKADVVKEMAKDMVVPGFRKGMAPITKVEERIKPEELSEHILSHILPKAFADSVGEHKFNPAIYPKYEALKIGQGSDWEIKATTCELPKVVLPKDYKKQLKHDKKDQNVLLKSILDTIKIEIPSMLVQEEVNARLSQVLERIEKLGLALEGYLKSVGKTPEGLKAEYEVQSRDSIALEVILNEIANEEKIEVTEKEVDEFIKTTGEDISKVATEQRDLLRRVILRRSALEKLSK